MKHSPTARRLTAAALALVATLVTAPAASADEARPESTHVVDALVPGGAAGAIAELPAAPTLDLGAAAVNEQQTWDYFRRYNETRIGFGLEPAIPHTQLNRLASSWALGQVQAGTLEPDTDLERKLPPGWTGGQHVIYQTIATDPSAAVNELIRDYMLSDWMIPELFGITDVGVGLVEQPWDGVDKIYTLYVIGVTYPHSTAQAGEMTLYRFSRPDTGTHFYSTTAAERNTVIGNAAFRYEGPVAYVLQPSVNRAGTSPLNRFYQPGSGTHFYTSTPAEYNRVLGFPQYSLDGVAGKVYTNGGTGRVPMYRFFRPASGTHFYTASAAEMEQVKKMPGYTFEGTAFFLRRAS